METTMQNINVTLPAADVKFFRELVKKMGWTMKKTSSKQQSGLDKALEDVEAGRVYKAKDVDDLFNQLMS